MISRIAIVLVFSLLSCEENVELRENESKISEDAPDLPGYLSEVIESVNAGESVTISIDRSKLTVASGTTKEDTEVRLRTLDSIPEREEVASLGGAKGDVVEVVMYDKDSEEIFASSVLEQPYIIEQALDDVSNPANLQYVMISAPGTEDEKIQTLSRKAITVSTALLGEELSVSIDLAATHVIIYAVESASVAPSVVILDTGADASNDSGGAVKASSSSSSSSSGSASSTTVPEAPSDISASSSSSEKVVLTWVDNSDNESSFKIERGTDGSNFSSLVTTATEAVSYDDTSVAGSTDYWYRVRACNAAGCSDYSTLGAAVSVPAMDHTIFMALSPNGGNLGGLSGADSLCQTAASDASVGGTWKAILSTDTVDAKDRITISGQIYNNNDEGAELVFGGSTSIWGPTALGTGLSLAYLADGTDTLHPGVLTGTNVSGAVSSDAHCENWTTNSAIYGRDGKADEGFLAGGWIDKSGQPGSCENTNRYIYCINQ